MSEVQSLANEAKRKRFRSDLIALSVARSTLNGLGALAPTLAGRLAAQMMTRTRRPRESALERLPDPGERICLDGPRGKLAVYRWGSGPLVVLVHGWNGRATQLGAFVAPLVRAGHEVVAFDAPGHGLSAGSHSSILDFAEAFDVIADAMRPFFRPIHGVIAHSMGGTAVAYALARRSGRSGDGEGLLREGAFARARLVFIAPPIDIRDFATQFSRTLGLTDRTRDALYGTIHRLLGRRLDALDSLELAGSMRAPLLVLHDELDRAVPVECGRRLALAWPGAELGVTRGLGHSLILRDESSVRRAVDFIRGDAWTRSAFP